MKFIRPRLRKPLLRGIAGLGLAGAWAIGGGHARWLAIVIAIPVAWYAMDKWLQGFAYRTQIGYSVFVFSGLIALSISLATISWQAIKAALMNPVKSLRAE